MALLHPCLLILVALPVTFSKWEDYITGKGGIKWLPNCEFPGFDIVQKEMTQEKCGQFCIATTHTNGCNAFSWQSGWCYLKKIPGHSLSRQPTTGGSCGVLPWEFEDGDPSDTGQDSSGIKSNITDQPRQIQWRTSRTLVSMSISLLLTTLMTKIAALFLRGEAREKVILGIGVPHKDYGS